MLLLRYRTGRAGRPRATAREASSGRVGVGEDGGRAPCGTCAQRVRGGGEDAGRGGPQRGVGDAGPGGADDLAGDGFGRRPRTARGGVVLCQCDEDGGRHLPERLRLGVEVAHLEVPARPDRREQRRQVVVEVQGRRAAAAGDGGAAVPEPVPERHVPRCGPRLAVVAADQQQGAVQRPARPVGRRVAGRRRPGGTRRVERQPHRLARTLPARGAAQPQRRVGEGRDQRRPQRVEEVPALAGLAALGHGFEVDLDGRRRAHHRPAGEAPAVEVRLHRGVPRVFEHPARGAERVEGGAVDRETVAGGGSAQEIQVAGRGAERLGEPVRRRGADLDLAAGLDREG
jgi:hypothetical protein